MVDMSERPEVSDWSTDFDPMVPEYNRDAVEIWKGLREGGCPIAHTDRYHGAYLATRYEDIAAIVHDPTRFSSLTIGINEVPLDEAGRFGSPPINSDPPEHHEHRRVLLPAFAPRAIERWEPRVRQICQGLMAQLVDRGSGCASDDYAKLVPLHTICAMLGLPDADGDQFVEWIHRLAEVAPTDVSEQRRVSAEMVGYFVPYIESRRTEPGDDIVSYLMEAEGGALDTAQITGTSLLLMVAGIDTTWSALGSAMMHLGLHASDRARLVAEPELMDSAVEEFLRCYAPVSLARVVTEDTEMAGTTLEAGQRVLLAFPAANLDPEFLDDAETFRIDRKVNRHIAFGLGIHRCLGSNLARMELRIALEEWLRHIPDFEVTDPEAIRWSVGQVRGPRHIPIAW